MSISSHDYLARNLTDMDRHDTHRHDTQPYGNYLDNLGNKLQLLTSDLRAEKSSRANTDKRIQDTERRIQGMFAQLNRMDQDTITNNQFLAQRLAGMEQTFDDGLAKEINNLASDMDGIEENIQTLFS